MILACPLCHVRYLIPASLFETGPRRVRCARCAHEWQAELPKEIDVVTGTVPTENSSSPLSDDFSAPGETPSPLPHGSNLPALPKTSWSMPGYLVVLFGVVLLGALGWAVLDRYSIAERWPSMEEVYDKVGLHIYHYGEGLSFEKVRSELRYDGGMTVLAVEGKIRNSTKYVQEIPNIKATALGADGKAIQSWQIDAPAIRVFPGEAMPFHSSIQAPAETVTDINLSFIEIKDAPQ